MSLTRLFLGLSVLIWLPYGAFCFFQPGYLEGAAGVVGQTATGTTEIRAMYGGLQAAIGALCLAALIRSEYERTALLTLAFLTAGLGLTRLLGLMIDGSASAYTVFATLFELASAGIAGFLARRAQGGVQGFQASD